MDYSLLFNTMNTVWQNSSVNESTQVNVTNFYLNDTDNQLNLLEILGPKRSPFALPITAVYLLIFFAGVTGNLLTCAVIAKHKKMHNPTNFYLVSLAASDLLVLMFGMPLEIYELWENYPFPFGEGGCYFKTFLFETICFASILNVTALSVERYIAVVHPLKTRYLSTNRHAKKVITLVWVASMTCAVPNTLLHGIYHLPKRRKESAICTVIKPLWIYNMVVQITTVCFYFVPMTIISMLYLVMGLHLAREKRRCNQNLGRNFCGNTRRTVSLENGRLRQVIKMLSIVVAVFGLCWAPFHIHRILWSSITEWTDLMHSVYQCVHIVSGVFFYLSSAVNPIIYSLLSTRFRECFRELICVNAPKTSSFIGESSLFPKSFSLSTSRSQPEANGTNTFLPNTSVTMDAAQSCAFKETTLCCDVREVIYG